LWRVWNGSSSSWRWRDQNGWIRVAGPLDSIHDRDVILLGILAALVAAGVLYQRLGVHRQSRQLSPPGCLVDVGGHRLHAICAGQGSPVVVLESAIAGSSLSWAIVQPSIAQFTRVCAYDRAGLGWSDPPSCARTVERILDELGAVLQEVGVRDPCVLVGHSFGSLVVRAYAARHPERVAGLVLIDPPIEWLTMTRERARLLWGGRSLSRVGAFLAHVGVVRACLSLLTGGAPGAPRRFVRIFGPTAAETLERLVGEVRKLPPEIHPVVQAIWCQPKCFHAMADHFLTLAQEGRRLAVSIPPPDIPTVVISSGGQPPEQLAAQRQLVKSSRSGRHVIAKASAHWVQFDEPELVVSVARELVERARHRISSFGGI
jgi:pimeloyl-ACP methyl ester carboxylesterase